MPINLADLAADFSEQRLRDAMARDESRLADNAWVANWLFADLLAARNERGEMSFSRYEGPRHLQKFFGWLSGTRFPDYLPASQIEGLAAISLDRDRASVARLELSIPDAHMAHMARYNAQDWTLQRLYPVPERQAVRVLLDFGAGHGRMANLGLAETGQTLRRYIAVDAISSTYLTQRAYFYGLGLDALDYIDVAEDEFVAELGADHQVVHVPTWRLDLIPPGSVDMVCCVQVLKELPRRLADWAIGHFARVVKPGGAVYVRDHLQFHSPSHMPIETVLQAHGFSLEYSAHVQDRNEIHGIPRIWRRYDVNQYLRPGD